MTSRKSVEKPKVLLITNMPSGHNVDLFNSVAGQAEAELKVIYLTPSTKGRTWETRPDLHHTAEQLTQWPKATSLYWSPGFLKVFRHLDFDILVLTQYANVPMQIASILARRRNIPIVVWLEPPGVAHSEAPPVQSEFFRRLGRRLVAGPFVRRATEIWAISDRAARQYHSMAPKASIVDYPYFGGIPEGAPSRPLSTPRRFLFLGKMIERKGVDLLVSAAADLLNEGTCAFQLRFVGDGPLSSQVRQLAKRFPENVEYHSQVERHQVTAHYQWADVCVVPSRYDGWSVVIPEAGANGCAIISTNRTGAASTLFGPGGAAVTVDPERDALREAIRRTISMSGDHLREMQEAARSLASNLTAEVGARRFTQNVIRLDQSK